MARFHQLGEPNPRSILVVLPTWVGDFVMATPFLRALRRRFADAHVVFLAEPNLRDLIRGGDWMDECVTWPAKRLRSPMHRPFRDLIWDLRRRRFDWAVLLPNAFRAAMVARLSGAHRRIGYDRDGRGWLLTDRLPVRNLRSMSPPRRPDPARGVTGVPLPSSYKGRFDPLPLVDYYAELAQAIDCEHPGDTFELFTTTECDESLETRLASVGAADAGPLVVLSPGAKYGAAKCWPTERFAGVADQLIRDKNATVIVTCGPGEEPIASRIADAMKQRAIVLDEPLLTLGELKSLIKRSDLLICNDAGPRHFAKAFDVPVVTIFGPTHPDWTATSYTAERIVRIDIACGPCQQRICPLGHLDCMAGVTTEMVFEAATELLATRSITPAPEPIHE